MDSNISIEITIGFAIVLCVAAFILSIFVYLKPDEKLQLNEDGLVDPNYITINAFLETNKGKTYMTNYLNTWIEDGDLITRNDNINIFINTNEVGFDGQNSGKLFNCDKTTSSCVSKKSFLLL